MQRFSIQQAAKQIGVHPATLRRWEYEGKVKPVLRDYKRQRVYTEADIARLCEFKEQLVEVEQLRPAAPVLARVSPSG